MASNKFNAFLNGAVEGLTNPKGVMGDWEHASRLFVGDTYRLSPRTKFLFYVRFELDKSVISSLNFSQKHADEVGFLIKSTDLPKYKFDSVTKNQYNRKKIFYKNFTYEPLTMTFHDDSNGIMNALWALYMSSYVQDRLNPLAAYSSTALRPAGTSLDSFRYGLDKQGRTTDFIKSISIYTMSRRRFLGYTLINPKIISWSHGNGDYSEVAFNENTMNIEYESVVYTGGNVAIDNPKGFATLYYDTVPSPLSVAGGGVENLLGSGGVLDGLESIFGDIQSGSAFDLTNGGALNTAIKAINTARNSSSLTSSSVRQELIGLISTPAALANTLNTVSGLAGSVFPKSDGTTALETQAVQKTVVTTTVNVAPTTAPPTNPVAQAFPVSGPGSVTGTPLNITNNP
jgi:hypothetical protein